MDVTTSKRGIYQIPREPEHLAKLLEALKPSFPFSNTMMSTIQNVLKKVVKAELFSDSWPQFTSIVCRISQPNIVDVVLFTTCNENLMRVICESQVLSHPHCHPACNHTVTIHVEGSVAQYLVDNITSRDGKKMLTSLFSGTLFYLPKPVTTTPFESTCPPGYFLGSLASQHTQFVISHWEYSQGIKNVYSNMEIALNSLPSSAAFSISDPANPVAWVLCYPYGHFCHWYTVEEHRRKGLGTAIVKDLALKLSREGYTPECGSANEDAIKVLKAVGFVEFLQPVQWLLYQHAE